MKCRSLIRELTDLGTLKHNWQKSDPKQDKCSYNANVLMHCSVLPNRKNPSPRRRKGTRSFAIALFKEENRDYSRLHCSMMKSQAAL
jgi:hypothetical protein